MINSRNKIEGRKCDAHRAVDRCSAGGFSLIGAFIHRCIEIRVAPTISRESPRSISNLLILHAQYCVRLLRARFATCFQLITPIYFHAVVASPHL